MNLLGSALYDPAVAVSKATSALLALTAFDTVNLRLAITVPAHGRVRFRMRCVITGATTSPTILLGVLNGATVLGRVAPTYENATSNAATQNFVCDAEFTVSGLAPGAMSVDAAYAVQVVVASTNIKYGGPNTNAGANAWGAFVFEAWDPQPVPTATPGAANGLQIAGANAATTYASLTSTGAFSVNGVSAVSQTGDCFARLGAPAGVSVSADVAAINAKTANLPAAPASTTNITAGTITTVTNLTNAPTAGDLTAVMKASVISAATAATPTAAAVTGAVGSVTGAVGSVTGLTAADVGAIKSTIGVAGAGLTALGDARIANLDAAVSTRLAAASYTAPDNASVAAVKVQTDKLAFTVVNKVDVNVKAINNVTVNGSGTAIDRWQP